MKSSDDILSLADRCVKCGLCLPQCPTYELTANENESPRGRIALIQGWLTGYLSPTSTLTNHLEQCLLCRRCERVCPSVVPYGEIMDKTRALLRSKTKTRFSLQTLMADISLNILVHKTFSAYLISLLRFTQKSGLFFIARKSRLLKLFSLERLADMLPSLEKTFKPETFYPAMTNEPGIQNKDNVALFTGCLSNHLDAKTVSASIRLLTRLGYNVHIPPQQGCCGALHLHQGKKKPAVKFANHNIHTFNQQKNITTVISLVNGCTSQLREYSQLELPNSFVPKVKDIIEFLTEITWPETSQFKALNQAVALQIPCSLQNTLRAEDKLISLLQRIPGINLPQHAIYNKCCGAAGSYFLRFPEISDRLNNQALDKLVSSSPKMVISSNLGCALQLKAGLTQRQADIDIIHPVVLLEQQLVSN